MRLIFGDPPAAPGPPAGAGWRRMPALGPKRIQNYGLLVSLGGMLLVGALLRGAIRPSSLWTTIGLLLIVLPLHELIHALATPGWGSSRHTILGVQRGKGLLLPYMTYTDSQPVGHMLLTGLAPLLLLSVLPVILILLAPLGPALRADLGFLAFFNMAISGGDLVNFFLIFQQIPRGARVQGVGWALYWRA